LKKLFLSEKSKDIPFFKSVILMCTICESCGVRSSEVKSGTGIEPKGCKYSLRLTDASDLNRDLLKSENASLEIPEIEFSMGDGTLGGKFTTIEGILKDCVAQLNSMDTIFASRDSETSTKAVKMQECIDTLELIHSGKKLDVTIVIDDPSGTSYLQVFILFLSFILFGIFF
jgi:zinc finger protein